MVKLELPRGMRDIEAEEFADISYVREKFLETARLFNFKLMEPSPLEMQVTLEAKSGAAISNEIYAFSDKGGRDVALRFDLTVGLARYVSLRRDLKMPAKFATFAGVWRYDEPQAGRYRYFHQWDIEVFGPFSQESDAEVIEFVSSFFRRLGLKVAIELSDRQLIEQFIVSRLGISAGETILDMFRAIDKVPKKGTQAVLQEYREKIEPAKLKSLIDLSNSKGSADEVAGKAHVEDIEAWRRLVGLMDLLTARGVHDVSINLGIIRGLDYYSGIVFEVFDPSTDLGALVGGGRYDRLTEAFGRKEIGATGAAGGVERIIMALKQRGGLGSVARPLVYVAYASEHVKNKALEIASILREGGIQTDYDLLGRALRRQLDDASNKGAALTAIVAPDEIASNQVIIRSMRDGTESKHPATSLPETITRMLKA
ncbi:MAG: histidine--tRNA ligase [Nitrososphaera sp.]|nr:histidine--tRNA ligase [Nitrososphaera sp.]